MAETTIEDEGLPKKRHRSPSYPSIGLRESVERLGKFYKIDGKAGAPPEVAVKHMGYSTAHGAAYSALAALKKFGLVAESNGRIVPTQRAVEIVNLQEADPRRIQAIKDAATSPTMYRRLIDENSNGLSGDDSLASELVTYKDFNPNAVNGFVKDFRDTLEFAGLSDLSALVFDPREQDAADGDTPEAVSTQVSQGPVRLPIVVAATGREATIAALAKNVTEQVLQARTRSYCWALSGEFTAKLDLVGVPQSEEDLEALRDYVDITIKALARSFRKGLRTGCTPEDPPEERNDE